MAKLPSAAALLIAALRANPTVTGLPSGLRIATRLGTTGDAALRITPLGGADSVDDTGNPELQIECWGPGTDSAAEAQASDMARTIHDQIPSLTGRYGPGLIVGAYTLGLPLFSPDPTTQRAREIVQVGLVVQP